MNKDPGNFEALDGLDQVIIIPNYLFGNKPLDPFLDKIDTSLTLGINRVEMPLKLHSPLVFSSNLVGSDLEFIKGLVYGASLLGTPFSITGESLTKELRAFIDDVSGKYIIQWSSDRLNVDAEVLTKASGIEIMIRGGIGSDSNTMRKTGKVHPSMHLDIESPKDLKKHIDLLKEITANIVPVIVTIGPGNVYGDMKYCIKAGADAVNIGLGPILDSSISQDFKQNLGIRTIGLFKPAQKAMKETNAKEDNIKLLVSGGFSSPTDIFKVLAMGADGISLSGSIMTSFLSEAITSGGENTLEWKSVGEDIAKSIKKMEHDLINLFAMISAPSKDELTTDCLRATTYDAAAVTGLKLMGYEKTLPMWMH
jgi:hypothetical protein